MCAVAARGIQAATRRTPPAPYFALRRVQWGPHLVLVLGVMIFVFPVYMAVLGSTHDVGTIARGDMPLRPGPHTLENYRQAWASGRGERVSASPVSRMMANTLIMALAIATGKIAISIISAFAVAFFRFPLRMFFFWMIFVTLMLPVEVRIIPTYAVVTNLGMIDTYAGLIIPLIASATATLIFRQFFLTVPDELVEAAKIDGAGPLRFFWSILLPISRTTIAALFVILFIYGWNQYLWPLLITTSRSMETIVIGITKMIGTGDAQTDWQIIMATALLAMLPPVLVIVTMQRWFVKGLTETEK
jgi:sn-glycerol 3-phosphate transport system permease protein